MQKQERRHTAAQARLPRQGVPRRGAESCRSGRFEEEHAKHNGEHPVVLTLDHMSHGKGIACGCPRTAGRAPTFGYESRHRRRPSAIRGAKLARQKRLLGHGNAEVVHHVRQRHKQRKVQPARRQHQRHPHEVVSEIQRMAHQTVHAAGVERLGDLALGSIPTTRAWWHVANGLGANHHTQNTHCPAHHLPPRVAGTRRGLIRQHERRWNQDEGNEAAPAEKHVAAAFEFVNEHGFRFRIARREGRLFRRAPLSGSTQRRTP